MRYLTTFLYTAFAAMLLVTSTPAFALKVKSSYPTWANSDTPQNLETITFRIKFSGAIDADTVDKNSFKIAINLSLHSPTSITRINYNLYEVSYTGPLLDNYEGAVEAFAYGTKLKGEDGTVVINALDSTSDPFIGSNPQIDNKVPRFTLQNVPDSAGLKPFTIKFALDSRADLNDETAFSVTNATRSTPTGRYPNYTSTVTPDGSGPVQITVAEGLFTDSAGNLSPTTLSETVALDSTRPTVTINGVPQTVSPDPFSVTFSTSEEVESFDVKDIDLLNATISDFNASSAQLFTALITPDGNGDVSVSVPADAFTDLQGNPNTASQVVSATLDSQAPSVSTIIARDGDATDGSLSWVVSFSEDVSGVGPNNFEVEGVEGGTITVTPFDENRASLPAFILRELLGVRRAFASSTATQYLVTVTGGNVATTAKAVLVFGSSAGILDAAGQGLISAEPTGVNQSSMDLDTEAPVVAQITAPRRVEGPFDATVVFSEAVTGFTPQGLVVTNATVNSVTPQVPDGGFATIYVVRMTPIDHGSVVIGVAAGAVADKAGNQNPVSGTVSVDYLDGEYVQKRTGAVIHNFMAQRGANILASQPDLSGRLMDVGGLGRTEKFALSTSYQLGSLQLNFAGSLTRLMTGEAFSELVNETAYGYEEADNAVGSQRRFNLWVKGSLTKSKLDGNEQGFGVFHAGADYRLTEDLMVGMMVQIDWADESNAAASTAASGTGWIAGPYAVYRLHHNVIVDGFVGYGQSSNKVSPFGTYTDDFDTSRFLAKAQVTGDFKYDDWTIAPQLSLSYLFEKQKSYVDTNGVTIPGQDIEIGQVTFGPSFRRQYVLDDGTVLSPSFGVKGVWNFKDAGTADISTGLISGSGSHALHARAEMGLGIGFSDRFRLNATGYVDGLGQSDYEAYGGSLGFVLPF